MTAILPPQYPIRYGEVLSIYPRRRNYIQVPWYTPKVGITNKYYYVDNQPVPLLDHILNKKSNQEPHSNTNHLTSTPGVVKLQHSKNQTKHDKQNQNHGNEENHSRAGSTNTSHYACTYVVVESSKIPVLHPRARTLPKRTSNATNKILFDKNFLHKSTSYANVTTHGDSMLRLNGFTNIPQENSPSPLVKSHCLKVHSITMFVMRNK